MLLVVIGLLAGCGGGQGSSTQAASVPASIATQHLQSDPYPISGPQPDHFVVSCDGSALIDSPPALDANGARYLYFSLSGFSAGSHVCDIAAADASNALSGADSVFFSL